MWKSRLGKIWKHLKKPPQDIAWLYLKASWQVENDEKRHRAYLAESVIWLTAFLSSNPTRDEAWKTAAYLRGELLRQLQMFEEGKAHFELLQKMEEFTKDAYPALIAYELELIGKKDSLLHEMPKKGK